MKWDYRSWMGGDGVRVLAVAGRFITLQRANLKRPGYAVWYAYDRGHACGWVVVGDGIYTAVSWRFRHGEEGPADRAASVRDVGWCTDAAGGMASAVRRIHYLNPPATDGPGHVAGAPVDGAPAPAADARAVADELWTRIEAAAPSGEVADLLERAARVLDETAPGLAKLLGAMAGRVAAAGVRPVIPPVIPAPAPAPAKRRREPAQRVPAARPGLFPAAAGAVRPATVAPGEPVRCGEIVKRPAPVRGTASLLAVIPTDGRPPGGGE